nr:uncharacterized protein LOC126526352 isoform X7 [Dermacentor andersoni]
MDYVIILALFLSPLLSYGLAPTNTAKKNNDHRVKMVKKLLNQKGSLAVSRGKYTQLDYPLCVRSRFEEYSLSGYFHKLIYYEEKEKKSFLRSQSKRRTEPSRPCLHDNFAMLTLEASSCYKSAACSMQEGIQKAVQSVSRT